MGSGTFNAAASETDGGRAFRPGPRTAFGVGLAAIAVATVLVITLASGGGGARSADARAAHYGRLPSWLPKISNSVRLELARVSHPILSEEQGYTVKALLVSGSADITAAGPEIPAYVSRYVQEGLWPDSHAAPGSFVVTLTNVRGTVPLAASAFSVLTDAGRIEHPKVTVRGGGRLPRVLHAGQHINLEVTAAVTEGSGSIRWAPLGARVLVGWIYQLELD